MIELRTAGIGLGVSAALSLAAAGCSTTAAGPQSALSPGTPAIPQAVAQIERTDGSDAGTATATPLPDGGIRIAIDATGLPQGPKQARIRNDTGCDAPDAQRVRRGAESIGLPSLLVGTDGRGELSISLPRRSWARFMNGAGPSIAIRSGARSNAGAQIACGVFRLR